MNSNLNAHLTLSPDALDQIADSLAARIEARLSSADSQPDAGWMDAKAAAVYLGLPSVNALHKLTSERRLDFSQRVRGAPCFFKRSDLDAYRETFMRGGR